ncbi:MAG TPA: DUF4956 domain-containing protein [Methanocorpusculum sp.]|nr:DUF4956 domain-containing protein [Methanocorpusculum sp.]
MALTFNDLLSTDLLAGLTAFSLPEMLICLALAFIVGLFIVFVYKKCFSGVMYSSGFAISLIAMAMITAMIILAIGSNLILSLGMVGALSIVRFRSAIKDPMDIVYIFWAISAGIVLGAGFIPLALIGSVFIGIILYLFSLKKPRDKPYIVIVNCDNDKAEEEVNSLLKTTVKKLVLRSKTINANGSIELTAEVRLPNMESDFVNKVNALPGVTSAVLVSYNGEYMT